MIATLNNPSIMLRQRGGGVCTYAEKVKKYLHIIALTNFHL
jgi:hypothetical protein